MSAPGPWSLRDQRALSRTLTSRCKVGLPFVALLDFAGTRLFLTPVTVFDDHLPVPPPYGLTHAVFEVADVDAELERLNALGTEVLIQPIEVSAALGSRRLAFCRSPGGLVFEVLQIRKSLV